MRLTTRTNLAMRTLMFCAVNPDRIVRKHEVAEPCGASENHLAQVIHLLARKGYIRTQRGRSGGGMRGTLWSVMEAWFTSAAFWGMWQATQ